MQNNIFKYIVIIWLLLLSVVEIYNLLNKEVCTKTPVGEIHDNNLIVEIDSIKKDNDSIKQVIDSIKIIQENHVEEVKHYNNDSTLELWYQLVKGNK